MRVLMISKALVNGVYQRKAEELAKLPDVELCLVVPPYWRENRVGDQPLQEMFTEGYELAVEPMRFNGHHHVHYYPGLGRRMRAFKPDIVHIDEEPYNFVTAHATRLARRNGAKTVFFAWQNLYRWYPPPFRLFELYNYWTASAAIVGNRDAGRVLRKKRYRGPISLIPQFGVDPEIFHPPSDRRSSMDGPVIGYIGRVVEEKGVDLLIDALAQIQPRPTLRIIGGGDQRVELEMRAERLGIRDRVRFEGAMPPERVPDVLRQLDILVLPSRTRPNWKEQFGRILVEAMSCEVAVVGSDSGEIPSVIGDAGLIFNEDDSRSLAEALKVLVESQERLREMQQAGRHRVLERFTQEQVANQTWQLYRKILGIDEGDS
ncbi:MAG: glycosyltransferase family 4 protein [Thermomicrobiales bacterium]